MSDQAETLRRLMGKKPLPDSSTRSDGTIPTICISGAHTGSGKSTLAANMSALLARSGLKVLILDISQTGNKYEGLLRISKNPRLSDLMNSNSPTDKVFTKVDQNLWVLPSSIGFKNIRESESEDRKRLYEYLGKSTIGFDLVIADIGCKSSVEKISFHRPDFINLISLTPNNNYVEECGVLIKLLRQYRKISGVGIIVNKVSNGREARFIYKKLEKFVSQILDVELIYIGHLPDDEKIFEAANKGKSLIELYPEAQVMTCLGLLTKRLKQWRLDGALPIGRVNIANRFTDEPKNNSPRNNSEFWKTLLGEVSI